MDKLFDLAVESSPKRLKASSLAVYRSMWRALESHLDPRKEGLRLVSPAELRSALQKVGSYATAKKTLALFRWVSVSVSGSGVELGDAYRELAAEYRHDDRTDHQVQRFDETASSLAQLAQTQGKGWKGARLTAIVRLLADTGIRREELLGLCLSAVSLDGPNPVINVGRGTRRRALPLSACAVEALRAWVALRPSAPCDLVFVSGLDGKAMDASTLWRQLRRLEGVTGPADTALSGPTAFRAGVARRLKKQGKSLPEIQQALGHRLASSTQELLDRV